METQVPESHATEAPVPTAEPAEAKIPRWHAVFLTADSEVRVERFTSKRELTNLVNQIGRENLVFACNGKELSLQPRYELG